EDANSSWKEKQPGRKQLLEGKTKGATDCSVAPGFVPSPRYFANFLLHDGVSRTRAGRSSRFGHISQCSLFEPEHGILHRAEIAVPGLVPGLGCGSSPVAQRRRAAAVVFGLKQVAGLRERGCSP